MRLVYFGSGSFGLPTLQRLAAVHEIALVVTQPDRPAGRHRALTPTPIAEFACDKNLPLLKPEDVNDDAAALEIHAAKAEAFVVIAFGQKLSQALLGDTFAINLHGSLLPKYRGAAPIQWAMINNEPETGISVIGLADRMDAGAIYGQTATKIEPHESAGDLHYRLALLGPELVLDVLERKQSNRLIPQQQDERLATRAPKLSKKDGTVSFDQSAAMVRSRVHGLTPWPGCTVSLGGRLLRLDRVEVADEKSEHLQVGLILPDFSIACQRGSIRALQVQPPSGKIMSLDAYRNGQPFVPGMRVESL